MSISGITTNLSTSDFIISNGKASINPSVLNGNPGMLLIWGDFCSWCHKFIPTYQQLSASLKTGFPCLAIESKQITPELSKALNFKGFPTIQFVSQNGEIVSTYSGPRDMNSLTDAICASFHYCVLNK